jgi:hypothetical protein
MTVSAERRQILVCTIINRFFVLPIGFAAPHVHQRKGLRVYQVLLLLSKARLTTKQDGHLRQHNSDNAAEETP